MEQTAQEPGSNSKAWDSMKALSQGGKGPGIQLPVPLSP